MSPRGLALLEGVVGVIVTFGGVALTYFSGPGLGTALGLVHMSLGVLAFPAAVALWTCTPWARRYALGLNVLTIAWSVMAETVVALDRSLATGEFLGSLAGTLIAVLLGLAIIISLIRRPRPNAPSGLGAPGPQNRMG